MSRPRDPKAADLDTAPSERVPERALMWEMRCGTCRFPWLALATDRQEMRLRAAAATHNQTNDGHEAYVVPRGTP